MNEALINGMASLAGKDKDLQLMLSQLTGCWRRQRWVGPEQGRGDCAEGHDVQLLYHEEVKEMLAEVDSKTTEAEKQEVRQRYAKLSQIGIMNWNHFVSGLLTFVRLFCLAFG
ncbi:hypothetical protein [Pseudomonas sp. FEN]|uniref:hypothetical protein n=1 Tax=Pseudomonas sp. FEN TaxID=2767468 RepID=UPI00174A1F7F|nr:hypothetical protein [Pseudomonas sp. FEN]